MVEFPLSVFVIMALASDNFLFIWFIILYSFRLCVCPELHVSRCVVCIISVGCAQLDALCVAL
jgi:hypothetical protein